MFSKMAISQLLIGHFPKILSLTLSQCGPPAANIQNLAHSKRSRLECFRYCSIFNKPAYKMRIFGHVQTPPPPLYAFECISVDPPTPPKCVHN